MRLKVIRDSNLVSHLKLKFSKKFNMKKQKLNKSGKMYLRANQLTRFVTCETVFSYEKQCLKKLTM